MMDKRNFNFFSGTHSSYGKMEHVLYGGCFRVFAEEVKRQVIGGCWTLGFVYKRKVGLSPL